MPEVAMTWGAHSNTARCTTKGLVTYVTKYITKTEPTCSAVLGSVDETASYKNAPATCPASPAKRGSR